MKLRKKTNYIVVHCSATKPSMDYVDAETIREWHVRDNGWRDIGYHSVILRNGVIEEGRDYNDTGAHVKGYNHESVGVCLVGGLSQYDEPEFNFTKKQLKSLKRELQWLKTLFPEAMIVGHNELSNTKACPSFKVRKWLKDENLTFLM